VKLGINLPYKNADGSAPSAAQLMQRAKLLEDIGYDGIWMGETVARFDFPSLDSLTWLAVAAAATQRVEIGTCVLQVPLRSPVELAQRLSTMQAISGGRFVAGLGSGSTPKDFEAVGVPFEERFRLLRVSVPIIQRYLNGETVRDNTIAPWPNGRSKVPIVIGAWGNGQWVKRAATQYDGWMASGFSGLAHLEEGSRQYKEAGGTGRMIVSTVNVNLRAPAENLGPNDRFTLNCPPAVAKERLEQLAEWGFDEVIVTRLNFAPEDWPEEDLRELRELWPGG
jgi:alkanesulfonate monooxygenase SsuD/methylene tetrahydromethanopterin reductase-like flavin-dependent oxidoreductase (luciferase family)